MQQIVLFLVLPQNKTIALEQTRERSDMLTKQGLTGGENGYLPLCD